MKKLKMSPKLDKIYRYILPVYNCRNKLYHDLNKKAKKISKMQERTFSEIFVSIPW